MYSCVCVCVWLASACRTTSTTVARCSCRSALMRRAEDCATLATDRSPCSCPEASIPRNGVARRCVFSMSWNTLISCTRHSSVVCAYVCLSTARHCAVVDHDLQTAGARRRRVDYTHTHIHSDAAYCYTRSVVCVYVDCTSTLTAMQWRPF